MILSIIALYAALGVMNWSTIDIINDGYKRIRHSWFLVAFWPFFVPDTIRLVRAFIQMEKAKRKYEKSRKK